MEACRIYELDVISDLACAISKEQSFVMAERRENSSMVAV
jgi:hypothetical protein